MLTFSRFEFECRWSQASSLPAFPGSLLRGALGHSLKKVVCALKHQQCESCLLKRQCLYARIFENKLTTSEPLNLSSLPHPYVIEWHPDIARSYMQGELFRFSLVLMGQTIEALPYFIYAIDRMGKDGLGKSGAEGKRNQMVLEKVYCGEQLLYSYENQELSAEIPHQQVSLEPCPDQQPVRELQLNLITPFRVKKEGKYTMEIDFPLLMQSIIRRLESLWVCYGDEAPVFDRDKLMSQTRTVTSARSDLHWKDQPRYSSRQSSKMQLGGVCGTIDFKGDIAPLMPYIKAAEQVHIGKATSFGLGRVSINQILK